MPQARARVRVRRARPLPFARWPFLSGAWLASHAARAAAVVDALGHEPYDLSEVATAVGLDRTTAYRLLETLLEHRLVVRDPHTRRYRLGLHAIDYANAVRDRLEVRHAALSHLVDLQHELDLQPQLYRCTLVALLDDLEVVLVETIGAAASQQALEEAGLPLRPHLVVAGQFDEPSGQTALETLLTRGEPFTALFVVTIRWHSVRCCRCI